MPIGDDWSTWMEDGVAVSVPATAPRSEFDAAVNRARSKAALSSQATSKPVLGPDSGDTGSQGANAEAVMVREVFTPAAAKTAMPVSGPSAKAPSGDTKLGSVAQPRRAASNTSSSSGSGWPSQKFLSESRRPSTGASSVSAPRSPSALSNRYRNISTQSSSEDSGEQRKRELRLWRKRVRRQRGTPDKRPVKSSNAHDKDPWDNPGWDSDVMFDSAQRDPSSTTGNRTRTRQSGMLSVSSPTDGKDLVKPQSARTKTNRTKRRPSSGVGLPKDDLRAKNSANTRSKADSAPRGSAHQLGDRDGYSRASIRNHTTATLDGQVVQSSSGGRKKSAPTRSATSSYVPSSSLKRKLPFAQSSPDSKRIAKPDSLAANGSDIGRAVDHADSDSSAASGRASFVETPPFYSGIAKAPLKSVSSRLDRVSTRTSAPRDDFTHMGLERRLLQQALGKATRMYQNNATAYESAGLALVNSAAYRPGIEWWVQDRVQEIMASDVFSKVLGDDCATLRASVNPPSFTIDEDNLHSALDVTLWTSIPGVLGQKFVGELKLTDCEALRTVDMTLIKSQTAAALGKQLVRELGKYHEDEASAYTATQHIEDNFMKVVESTDHNFSLARWDGRLPSALAKHYEVDVNVSSKPRTTGVTAELTYHRYSMNRVNGTCVWSKDPDFKFQLEGDMQSTRHK